MNSKVEKQLPLRIVEQAGVVESQSSGQVSVDVRYIVRQVGVTGCSGGTT